MIGKSSKLSFVFNFRSEQSHETSKYVVRLCFCPNCSLRKQAVSANYSPVPRCFRLKARVTPVATARKIVKLKVKEDESERKTS